MSLQERARAVDAVQSMICEFVNSQGVASKQFSVPAGLNPKELNAMVNTLVLELTATDQQQYSFFLNDAEITTTLRDAVALDPSVSLESTIKITYRPVALFRVQPVTRCTSTLPGHTAPILSVHFSPDGEQLASGSGDKTVRLWDIWTQTPRKVLKGHRHWVLAVEWSPCGRCLASGSMDKELRIWDAGSGKSLGVLRGHSRPVTCISWEPIVCSVARHRRMKKETMPSYRPEFVATGSQDGTVKIWNIRTRKCVRSMSGHAKGVTSVLWGGGDDKCSGVLYSASEDRTIKVWRVDDGVLIRTLQGHGHWVNRLALNTSHALRRGPWENQLFRLKQQRLKEQAESVGKDLEQKSDVPQRSLRDGDTSDERKLLSDKEKALGNALQTPIDKSVVDACEAKYMEVLKVAGGKELLVSASDDHTAFVWDAVNSKKPITRLTGHQQPINYVAFSPDGRMLATGSFDKSVKLWDALQDCKYISTFRGHAQAVYQLAWSADSRFLLSSSKDSTVKVWNVRTKKLQMDLPGHADEVFAVDWSPDGRMVASGGKDRLLKLWQQ